MFKIMQFLPRTGVRRSSLIFGASLLLLAGTALISVFLGEVSIAPGTVFRIFLAQLPFAGHYFNSGFNFTQYEIIVLLREPEIFGGIVIGAVLGVGGAAIQSIFRNPITEPYMIGVSSGAALGAVLAIALGVAVFGFYTLQILAFLFSVALVSGIYLFSFRNGRVPVVYLLLVGIAVSVFVSSLVAYLLYTNPNLEGTSEVFFWLMGSLENLTWSSLIPVAVISVCAMLVVTLLSSELNAIQLGEDYAKSVGVRVELTKVVTLIAVTLGVSAAVSVSGLIGFVGLIVPHISRLLHGGSNSRVIPSSAILGAIFLVLSFDISRLIAFPKVIPIGIITGLIGVPFFVFLLRKLAGGYYAD